MIQGGTYTMKHMSQPILWFVLVFIAGCGGPLVGVTVVDERTAGGGLH